jgi:hypothetical protein
MLRPTYRLRSASMGIIGRSESIVSNIRHIYQPLRIGALKAATLRDR